MTNLRDKLEKYASDYYMNTAVENDPNFPNLFRIQVPEADQEFLLGLGQFDLILTKIRPMNDNFLKISVVIK